MSRYILEEDGFGRKMYGRLPKVYQRNDVEQKYQLQRYFDATDAATKPLISELNKFLTFYDPKRVDVEVIPYVFSSFGLELFHGIPEPYARNLIPMLGQLYKRKGTYKVIEYLTSVLTDAKVTVDFYYEDGKIATFMECLFGHGVFGSKCKVIPVVTVTIELTQGLYGERIPDKEQLKRLIKEFMPFYALVRVIFMFVYTETATLVARDVRSDHIEWHAVTDRTSIEVRDSGFEDLLSQKWDEDRSVARLYDGEIATFMKAVFGKAVFGQKVKVWETTTYDRRMPDLVHEKGADEKEIIYFDSYLKTKVGSKNEADNRKVFTKESESDIIRLKAKSDRGAFSNVGYTPKTNAIFMGGQPFGNAVMGATRGYTTVDHTVDTITYNDGTTKEIVTE